MDRIEASEWLDELAAKVRAGRISKREADNEVFAEMEEGDHDADVETLYFNFTQDDLCAKAFI